MIYLADGVSNGGFVFSLQLCLDEARVPGFAPLNAGNAGLLTVVTASCLCICISLAFRILFPRYYFLW